MKHGLVPISLAHSSPNSDQPTPLMDLQFTAQIEEKDGNPSKQHIAYHMLSNLWDDEITDDGRSAAKDAPRAKTELNDM